MRPFVRARVDVVIQRNRNFRSTRCQHVSSRALRSISLDRDAAGLCGVRGSDPNRLCVLLSIHPTAGLSDPVL